MIALYPAVPAAHQAYGDYLASQNNVSKAVQEWQTALSFNKDFPAALQRMGQVSLGSGKYSDAITYFKHYTQVSPDAQGFALLGQAYSFVHDYKNAKDACGRSFQIQRSPVTLGCVGGADFELKNYKEAAQIFDALSRGAPKFLNQNPQMLYVAAKSYENTKQPAKAVAAYKKLLPMMKKGTKEYAQVQQSIATQSKAISTKKKA
jgi:tetratricopeptide (TPR) repeat protein